MAMTIAVMLATQAQKGIGRLRADAAFMDLAGRTRTRSSLPPYSQEARLSRPVDRWGSPGVAHASEPELKLQCATGVFGVVAHASNSPFLVSDCTRSIALPTSASPVVSTAWKRA